MPRPAGWHGALTSQAVKLAQRRGAVDIKLPAARKVPRAGVPAGEAAGLIFLSAQGSSTACMTSGPYLSQPRLQPSQTPSQECGICCQTEQDEAHHAKPALSLGAATLLTCWCACAPYNVHPIRLPPAQLGQPGQGQRIAGTALAAGAAAHPPDDDPRRLLWREARAAAMLQERSQRHCSCGRAGWPGLEAELCGSLRGRRWRVRAVCFGLSSVVMCR